MNFSEVLCTLRHFFSIWLCASSFPFLQGMSDLLSPILFVMEDESESFWCFVALMERLGPNFNRDQNGMHSQLFALSKVSLSLSQTHTHTHKHA